MEFRTALTIVCLALGATAAWAAMPFTTAESRTGFGPLNFVAISPDKSMVAGTSNHGIAWYDTQSGEMLGSVGLSYQALALLFSPDATRLAYGNAQTFILNTSTGEEVKSFSGARPLAWSPDGSLMLLRRNAVPSTVDVINTTTWDVQTSVALQFSYGNACGAISPDNSYFSVAQENETMKVWRMSDGAEVFSDTVGGPSSSFSGDGLHFSPDGSLLALRGDTSLYLYEVDESAISRRWSKTLTSIDDFAFSVDGETIGVADFSSSVKYFRLTDGTSAGSRGFSLFANNTDVVMSYDGTILTGIVGTNRENPFSSIVLETGLPIASYEGFDWRTAAAAHDPETGHILTVSYFGGVDEIDLQAGEIRSRGSLSEDSLYNRTSSFGAAVIGFDPDPVVIGGQKNLIVYDVQTSTTIRSIVPPAGVQNLTAVAFNGTSRTILAGFRYGRVCLFDYDSGNLLHDLDHQTNADITSVAIAPDGRTLVSVDDDLYLRFWSAETGASLRVHRPSATGTIESLQYSPSGDILLVGGNTGISMIDTATLEFRDQILPANEPSDIDYSSDGKTFLALSRLHPVLMDSQTGEVLRTLIGWQNERVVLLPGTDKAVLIHGGAAFTYTLKDAQAFSTADILSGEANAMAADLNFDAVIDAADVIEKEADLRSSTSQRIILPR